MPPSIEMRLSALENRPGSQIPHFIVETMDGNTITAHGYGLLTISDVRRVHFDPMNSCANTVIDLFQVLRGDEVEIVPYVH